MIDISLDKAFTASGTAAAHNPEITALEVNLAAAMIELAQAEGHIVGLPKFKPTGMWVKDKNKVARAYRDILSLLEDHPDGLGSRAIKSTIRIGHYTMMDAIEEAQSAGLVKPAGRGRWALTA